MRRRDLHRWAAAAVAGVAGGPALAQALAFPSKPLKIVLPSPPGGTNDIIARLVADKLGAAFAQKLVVENRPGGGGIVGVQAVAKAPADGHTLLVSFAGPLTVNIDPEAEDPARTLTPVAVLAELPYALVGRADLSAQDLRALLALSQTTPGGLRVANGAVGSDAHLLTELFRARSGMKFLLVPYPGTGPALKDMLGGHVDLVFTSFPAVAQHIAAGTIRPYAVATAQRWPLYPDVPTLAEQGVAGVLGTAWFALMAPAGTPAPVLDRLHQAVTEAFGAADVREGLQRIGAQVRGDSRAASTAFIAAERAKWAQVVRETGIRLR